MLLTESKSSPSTSIKGDDSTRTIGRSLARFLTGTLASRVTGLMRDASMAAVFGSAPLVAAFMVAFRFSHLLRRLLGEGALHAAFIPHFEAERQEEPGRAFALFRDLSLLLSLFLTILLGGSTLLLYFSQGSWSAGNNEVVELLVVMLPSALFICLFGLNSALLQCEQRYFLPAAAPIAFNLVWIGGVYALWDAPIADAMRQLSWVIVVACVGQWLVTLPIWRQAFLQAKRRPVELFSPSMRTLLRALGLGMLGVGAAQLNSALDTLFARSADLSGPAYLWWAIRVYQAPIGLFGVALAGALLPPLSRALKRGDEERFRHFLLYAMQNVLYVGVPLTGALLVTGAATVDLIYGRGAFGSLSLVETTRALWGYSLGLLPALGVMILAPAYYARGDYRTPVVASTISVTMNILLNTLLVFGLGWGASAVAVATSIASLVNFILLALAFTWLGRGMVRVALLSVGSTLVAMLVASWVGSLYGDATWSIMQGSEMREFSRDFTNQLLCYLVMTLPFGLPLLVWLTQRGQDSLSSLE